MTRIQKHPQIRSIHKCFCSIVAPISDTTRYSRRAGNPRALTQRAGLSGASLETELVEEQACLHSITSLSLNTRMKRTKWIVDQFSRLLTGRAPTVSRYGPICGAQDLRHIRGVPGGGYFLIPEHHRVILTFPAVPRRAPDISMGGLVDDKGRRRQRAEP